MQIGPKIRVGGSLGKLGNKAKKYAVPLALTALASPVLGALGGAFLRKVGGGEGAISGAAQDAADDAISGVTPSAVADPSRFRRVASGVGDFIGKHKDSIIDYGAAAEGLYDRNRQRGFQDEVMDDYRRRRPLRDRGQSLLLDESQPDLSGITADPNIRYRRVTGGY